MSSAGHWIDDHKKQLALAAAATAATVMTAGAASPLLAGAAGAATAGAAAAPVAAGLGAGTAAGLGGGTASLFGAGAADAAGSGLAGGLLGSAATPAITGSTGLAAAAPTAAGAGMGGGAASLFGPGQLTASEVGPSQMGLLKAGLTHFNSKIQPILKAGNAAQKIAGMNQPPATTNMQRPPGMGQQQPLQSTQQIMQAGGGMPNTQLTPEMIAKLRQMGIQI